LGATNGILGKYLRAEFLLCFFETFFEDRKIDKIHGNIIFFQSVPGNKRVMSNKLKTGEKG